jgi:hypothetical protein
MRPRLSLSRDCMDRYPLLPLRRAMLPEQIRLLAATPLRLLPLEFLQECLVPFRMRTLLYITGNPNITWVNLKVELVTTMLLMANSMV